MAGQIQTPDAGVDNNITTLNSSLYQNITETIFEMLLLDKQ